MKKGKTTLDLHPYNDWFMTATLIFIGGNFSIEISNAQNPYDIR